MFINDENKISTYITGTLLKKKRVFPTPFKPHVL
jgi:hypothetical protein